MTGRRSAGSRIPRFITNICRGRCSHRPGELAAAQGFAGGPWPSPTNRGKRPAKRGGHDLRGKRRAGCPHPAGPCGGTSATVLKSPRCGGRERPPYGTRETRRLTGKPRPHDITNPCRDRFYIGPGAPRRRKHPGRIWNPPLRPAAGTQPTGKPRPRTIANLCRGRCSHRPGDLAAAWGFAGGPWPSPANRGKRPAKRGGHDLPGKRRAGCPHPAGPCGGTNATVLKSPRCGGRERPPCGAPGK